MTTQCSEIRCQVTKKRDGFFVVYDAGTEGFCDYMNFLEGAAWRLFKILPTRMIKQMPVIVRPLTPHDGE